MSDMDFDGFFIALEKIEQERLLEKPASQLLLESAAPFDAACIKVKTMEKQLEQQAKSIDELVEAIYKIRDTVAIKAFWEISHNDIAEELAIADKFKTNKQDK